jgi:hypothetical protein
MGGFFVRFFRKEVINMSPEIRINEELVANVPDDYGAYIAIDGTSLLVDSRQLDARGEIQRLILEGPAVGGRRIVGLTLEGKGNSGNIKKGGDGQEPTLDVTLLNRPIRVSYWKKHWVERTNMPMGSPREGYYTEVKSTYRNPRWSRR